MKKLALLLLAGLLTAPAFARDAAKTLVTVIYYNGNIETMAKSGARAQAVAVQDGKLAAVGTDNDILSQYTSLLKVDLKGATVLPGFIDTHSHPQGWGVMGDAEHWLDVSSVNIFLKPKPEDKRCIAPTDPQLCFIPVKNQDEVMDRLRAAAAKAATMKEPIVLASSYDPARLGHGAMCGDDTSKVGFACPNFEDGHARAYLDSISSQIPILVGSQSGHIVYVNTPYLAMLNICGTDVANPQNCTSPILPTAFPSEESQMANLGQLNEDLSGLALGNAVTQVVKNDINVPFTTFRRAIDAYVQHGFTFVQEGAVGDAAALFYSLVALDPRFRVTAALLYNNGSTDYAKQVSSAENFRKSFALNPNLRMHGLKEFADGSNQGYTGLLKSGYTELRYPFTDPDIFPSDIFGDPYLGVPDSDAPTVTAHAAAAHAAGFPLGVHQNGDGAIAYTLEGLQAAPNTAHLRDLMIHFSLASPEDLATAKSLDAGVTFLMTNLYYYGLPMCEQVLGPARTAAIYPAGDAAAAGVHFGLHADSPVGPPDVMFMVWVAKTRKTQQPSWYPNADPVHCPVVLGPEQAISIRQGIQAFTSDAAYLYGLEEQYGTVEKNKFADLVVLSANPLEMEAQPDRLKDVQVLATIRHGVYIANPNAGKPPIWPD